MAAPEVPIKNSDAKVKIRNPVTTLILDIVTIGIYGLFWWYYVNREMADLGRARGTNELGDNPTNSVLAIIPGALIIVPAILTFINTGKRIKAAQRLSGQPEDANEWIGLVLLLVFFPVGMLYLQQELNKVWEREAESPALGAGAEQPGAAQQPGAQQPGAQGPAGAQPAPDPSQPGTAEPGTPDSSPESRPPGQ